MKKCIKCNAELENDAEFCSECGERQPATGQACPKCGQAVEAGTEFCPECGQKLEKPEAPAAPAPAAGQTPTMASAVPGPKRKLIAGIAAALIAVAAVFFLTSGSAKQVKAEDMINDYVRDQASAEQTYKGKNVQITGTLLSKRQFDNSSNYGMSIAAKTAGGRNYIIVLDVDSDKVKSVNNVNIGDFVSAKGKCVGIVKQDDPLKISVQIKVDSVNE